MEKKDFFPLIIGNREPPLCAAPDEVQSEIIGIPFSIDLVASDPSGRIIDIKGISLPPWAALTVITELPSPDAVACISGVPQKENEGFHIMSVITSNSDGNQAVSHLKIKLTDYGFTDEPTGVF